MQQVVAHHDQLGAERVRCVRVPHPVWARAPQLLGGRWPFVLDCVGFQFEEPSQHVLRETGKKPGMLFAMATKRASRQRARAGVDCSSEEPDAFLAPGVSAARHRRNEMKSITQRNPNDQRLVLHASAVRMGESLLPPPVSCALSPPLGLGGPTRVRAYSVAGPLWLMRRGHSATATLDGVKTPPIKIRIRL